MPNYLDLPSYLHNFVKSVDYKPLCHVGEYHGWTYQPLINFINEDGINWFKSVGFDLPETLSLFRIPANYEGDIHTDINARTKHIEFAINIVLEGFGEMQWLENIKGKKYIAKQQDVGYISYSDVDSFDTIDRWRGDVGLVRIDHFHRIVSFDQERVCLSIRPTAPKSFNQAQDILLAAGII